MNYNNSNNRYTAPKPATGTSAVLCVAALALAIGAANTHAQNQGAGARALEEVIVTATRREESIQSIATSIQAVTGPIWITVAFTALPKLLKPCRVLTFSSPKVPPAQAFISAVSAPPAPVLPTLLSGWWLTVYTNCVRELCLPN
jgi:hypothetical protein